MYIYKYKNGNLAEKYIIKLYIIITLIYSVNDYYLFGRGAV
jgi:hypothetical protein